MSLEIVIGPMFSGKTSYVYSLVKRYRSVGVSVVVIKPDSDNRYSILPEIVTHDGIRFECVSTNKNLMELDHQFTSAKVIAIEEAQFFDDLELFVRCMVENFNKNVIIVGLDGDYNRKPFGQILQCIPIADKVTKLNALCSICCDGTPALFSHRKNDETGQVLIGGSDKYEPLCRKCYIKCKYDINDNDIAS
jgi:thymidine kinase